MKMITGDATELRPTPTGLALLKGKQVYIEWVRDLNVDGEELNVYEQQRYYEARLYLVWEIDLPMMKLSSKRESMGAWYNINQIFKIREE